MNSLADPASLQSVAGTTAIPTDRALVLTHIVDEVFRLNSVLLAEGDRLVESAGLTAARWRVLGELANAPATVAHIALRRGLRRQSVQESVERLENDGMVSRVPNAADRRAPLVLLTEQGKAALAAVEPARTAWAASRSADLDIEGLRLTLSYLQQLRLAER